MFPDRGEHGEHGQDEESKHPNILEQLVMAPPAGMMLIPVRPKREETQADGQEPAMKETGYQKL